MITRRKKITILAVISVIIVSFAGLQINEIIAEPTGTKKYTFAENVKITAVFEFKDGVEITQAQTFEQKRGFNINNKPVFKLVKVIGNTPLLYAVTDATQQHRDIIASQFPTRLEFDVEILLANEGEILRSFAYQQCRVAKYNVNTESDKEEGYVSKSEGFAVVDEFTFQCKSHNAMNPLLESLIESPKAKTFSSKDYQKIQEERMKISPTSQGTGSGSYEIPNWIKTNAGWWAEGQISDSDYVEGIQWLIKNGIIRIA